MPRLAIRRLALVSAFLAAAVTLLPASTVAEEPNPTDTGPCENREVKTAPCFKFAVEKCSDSEVQHTTGRPPYCSPADAILKVHDGAFGCQGTGVSGGYGGTVKICVTEFTNTDPPQPVAAPCYDQGFCIVKWSPELNIYWCETSPVDTETRNAATLTTVFIVCMSEQ